MKNKKGFALIISLALVIAVALPGTLALSTDQAATNGELTVAEETPTPTPEVTETPTPTEEPKPTESPVPSETEKPAETEAPKECPCHLFDRLMACQTLEEIEAIIKATPEDVLKSLSEEQVAQVEAYMDKLMPAPLPAIVIEESEPPVESEIYRPTVNYTNVAPFGDPVTGGDN